ncbi:UDP-N-acetylglucosamine 2-epimerase [Intrasporangium chromatireducens Q5-1]|uniref:UDP-N-acetylglucosamine 2-epimerase n=1 Tax=Intrasporangium chromatireducens Q5-1 TaxID=584657 RepID=W9GMT0_9MICO|nr:UDP-N-acetylglucosamine 2-epimerase [Intrasporangium chromatireducens Q5-1]
MKVLSVVGARPQFVKLAPIAAELERRGDEHVIVHTGQHYDVNMSDVFFSDLGIAAPDDHLAVGSDTHGRQTGAMLAAMDEVLERHQPDWVLVYGDTNSTIAGALAAVKSHIRVAHLEAGLRSFNRRMPEEHNRVMTDHAADLCLAPTEVAMAHLREEGLSDRSVLVGDVMTDVLYQVRDRVVGEEPAVPAQLASEPFRVATLHRAENTDDPHRLAAIIKALGSLPEPTLLLAHPRLRARAAEQGLDLAVGSLVVSDPLAYPQLVSAVMASIGVVTDSGGLQKEAFLLRVPCVTVRSETEWTETVDLGWNVLAEDPAQLPEAVLSLDPHATTAAPYGDGHAARRAIEAILAHGGSRACSR